MVFKKAFLRKILIGLVLIFLPAALVWFSEALTDYYIHYPGEYDFKDLLYADLPKGEAAVRMVVTFIFWVYSAVVMVLFLRLQKTGKELKERTLHTRSVLNSIADAVIAVDTENKITGLNPVAENILGVSEEEALRRPAEEFLHLTKRGDNGSQAVDLSSDNLYFESETGIRALLRTANDNTIPVVYSKACILNNGLPEGMVFVIKDESRHHADVQALQEAEARYRSLFYETPLGNFNYDLNGVILDCNDRFVETIGSSKEILLGLNMLTQLNDEKIKAGVKRSLEVGLAGYEGDYVSVTADKITPVRVIFKGLRDNNGEIIGGMGLVEDISERKAHEKALQESETQLLRAQKIGKMGSWAIQLKTGEVNASEEAYRIYGFEYPKPFGIDDIQAIVLPEYREMMDKALEDLIHGKSKYRVEFQINRPADGTVVDIRSVAEYDSEENRVTGIIQNITEVKAAERALRQRNDEYFAANEELKESLRTINRINEQLKEAKDRAEESDRLKSIFLANLSHEIRTPMNGILGFTSILKEGSVNSEQQYKYLEMIEISGERMLNTLNDIISISLIEAGESKVNLSEINLQEMAEYLYELFKPEADRKGLALSAHFDFNEIPGTIRSDKEKLYAVFTNLIKNAVKYTEDGSVRFGADIQNGKLVFYVSDTGIGISSDRRKAVFERFVQAGTDITNPNQGIGLGLSIVKAYIEMLNGDISLDSEPRKGSRFSFYFPIN